MTSLKALIVGFVGALAFAAGGEAADAPQSWSLPPAPDYVKQGPRYLEMLSGWYLRGDLGYRWNGAGSTEAASPLTSQKYGNAVGGTFGFGYKYQWLRVDLTVDRGVPSKFSGTTAKVATQPQYTAKIGSITALANAYIDFGTWAGFTPYVGGGIGVAQLKSTGYADTSQPLLDTSNPGHALNFSWAWMAGVAFQVQPNWMIDVGFRHLEMGDVPSINGAGTPGNNAAVFKNLKAQEARVGVRFLFD